MSERAERVRARVGTVLHEKWRLDAVLGGGSLPVGEVISLAEQVADVLAAAHDKGIVHCERRP